MQSYLPKDSAGTSSGYAEGGGLYALGLIHANHGGDITEYLLGEPRFISLQSLNSDPRIFGILIKTNCLISLIFNVLLKFAIFLGQVKEATSEQIKHGGCLGLGLAAMGTHRGDVYEQLKFCLYQVIITVKLNFIIF